MKSLLNFAFTLTIFLLSFSSCSKKCDILPPTPVVCGDTTLPMELSGWNCYSYSSLRFRIPGAGVFEKTTEGLKAFGESYRYGARIQTKEDFCLKNKTVYMKWKVNGANAFSATAAQIKYNPLANEGIPAVEGADFCNLTTSNVFNGSVLISNDTWYYTRIKLSNNSAATYTAAANYDNAGGNIIQQSTTAVNTQAGYIGIRLGDPYGGNQAYIILSECKINNQ
jgi:hypothetical protein